MLAALILALAAASPEARPLPGGPSSVVLAVERMALPRAAGCTALDQDPLRGVLELACRAPAAVVRGLGTTPGRACPAAEVAGPGRVVLRCTTKRFQAHLVGPESLEVVLLRGLPQSPADTAPPRFGYDDPSMALTGQALKAERLLVQGHKAEAAALLREALTSTPTYASIRLGDLALEEGEVALAAGWYMRAPRHGVFGRLALARECELTGSCFSRLSPSFSGLGLPEPARTEVELREARALLLLGRTADAAGFLARRLQDEGRPPACSDAAVLCRRVALAALTDAAPDARSPALLLYLALPHRDHGPLAVELARAASEAAASLGAPLFAANVLASVEGLARTDVLDDHLARAAELYLSAKEVARAAVIVAYARSRLSPRQLAGARWKAIVAAIAPAATPAPVERRKPDEGLAPELARSEQAVGRARAVRALENP